MNARHRLGFCFLVIFSLALISGFLSGSLRASTIYNAGVDLAANPTANPNGAWTYGGYNSGLTVFTPFGGANGGASYTGVNSASPGASFFDGWGYNITADGLVPAIAVNTGTSIEQPIPSITAVAIDQLWVHPGPGPAPGPSDREPQDQVDLRWTSPAAGTITLSTSWTQLDAVAAQAHVLINGVSVFNQAVAPAAIFYTVSTPMAVSPGTTIDFITARNPTVGNGSNSTQMTSFITFTPVPEPASIALLAAAGAVWGGLHARRRWLARHRAKDAGSAPFG